MEKLLTWERVGGGVDFKDIYIRRFWFGLELVLDLDVVIGDGKRQFGEGGEVIIWCGRL